MNIVVYENEEYVEVCINITSSLAVVMRNVTIDVLIEPGKFSKKAIDFLRMGRFKFKLARQV